jgi:hypothetical protein
MQKIMTDQTHQQIAAQRAIMQIKVSIQSLDKSLSSMSVSSHQVEYLEALATQVKHGADWIVEKPMPTLPPFVEGMMQRRRSMDDEWPIAGQPAPDCFAGVPIS